MPLGIGYSGVPAGFLDFYREQLGRPGTVVGQPLRPATQRRQLRRVAHYRPNVAAMLRGRRPAIFDPIGARFLKRTVTARGIVRATRRVR